MTSLHSYIGLGKNLALFRLLANMYSMHVHMSESDNFELDSLIPVFVWCLILKEHGSQRPERTSGASSMLDSVHVQSDQTGARIPSTFGNPASFSLGSLQPPVSFLRFWVSLLPYLSP